MKGDNQKHFQKLTLFFLSNTVPFNGQSYQKEKVPATSGQSLFRLRSKFRKLPLIVPLFANLCKAISSINYSISICPFESGNCEKKVKKIQKSEYLKNEKSCFDAIKNMFYNLWKPSFGEKIKIWKTWHTQALMLQINLKRKERLSRLVLKVWYFIISLIYLKNSMDSML